MLSVRDIWGKSTSLSFLSFKIISAAETLDISKRWDRLYSVSNLIENSGPHPHAVREISDIVTSSEWASWDVAVCERCVCGIEFHIFPPHLNIGRRSKIWGMKVTRFTLQLPSAPISTLRWEISPVLNAQPQMFTGEKKGERWDENKRYDSQLPVLRGLECWSRVENEREGTRGGRNKETIDDRQK